MNSAYSHLKAFRHPDVMEGIRRQVPRRLPHVELILADLCQQHCKFCAYRLDGYASNQRFDERRLMPIDKALEIVEDCAEMGVQAIQFTGGGEPTIYPEFARVVRRVIELGMRFSLVSNGVRMTPALAELVVQGSWVRISLDAATQATYVTSRRVHKSHWESAKNAVKYLREARDRLKTNCVIGTGFVVTPDNWKEVVLAAILARGLGADNIRISAQFSNEDEKLFSEFHAEAARLCAQAVEVGGPQARVPVPHGQEQQQNPQPGAAVPRGQFTVYNRFGDRLEDLRFKQPEDRLCGYQFFTTYIGADLQVYRCCGYAYNDRGLVGSLAGQRFKDFWMSQERFDNQINFDGRGCERCQFRKINSALAYVLEPQAQMHEEFV